MLSDITGVTGLAIPDAIRTDERDLQVLARHTDYRIKAAPETIAKALVGDYQRSTSSPCASLSCRTGTTRS